MRLAHLKCPNCDGFVEFNDAQGLFCKSCGTELMVQLDPEDLELEQLKAMPEILNDKYIYEKKLYESELRQQEEINKQQLVNEWKQNRPLGTPQKKKKFVVGYVIAIVAVVVCLFFGSIILGLIFTVKSSISNYKADKAYEYNPKGLITVEMVEPDTHIENFNQLSHAQNNSLRNITYCMTEYLKDIDGQDHNWDSIELYNAYMGRNGDLSNLVCVFEQKGDGITVYRVVKLNGLTYDHKKNAVVTDMDFHLSSHSESDLKGAYSDPEEIKSSELSSLGSDMLTYWN